MQEFLTRFADRVIGVLSGFDRVLFRGQPRHISYPDGFGAFLYKRGILLKNFRTFVKDTTQDLRDRVTGLAAKLKRPVHYLRSNRHRKEDIARDYLRTHPTDDGLICLLSAVEPCMTFDLHKSRETKRLELRQEWSKCLHYYAYLLHRQFGFMHVRLQTWFPFTAQVCINGREWLARTLDACGMDYRRFDNCIYWAEDLPKAQRLFDRQLDLDWLKTLDRVLAQFSPGLCQILDQNRPFYYWCGHQTEWATDVLFRDRASLQAIFPALVRHATTAFSSRDVLHFLGRKPHHAFTQEITTDFKDRQEGIRVKHWVGVNSQKMYDKLPVLRVETTTNDPTQFRALRPRASTGELALQPIRKSVADLGRRAETNQRANERYLDALADVEERQPVKAITDPVSSHTTFRGRRVRAIRFWDKDDIQLLTAINRGDFIVNGFRNRDIASILFPLGATSSSACARKRSAKVSRLFRILRAHEIIRQLPHSRRHQVTKKGRTIITAVLAARDASLTSLLHSA